MSLEGAADERLQLCKHIVVGHSTHPCHSALCKVGGGERWQEEDAKITVSKVGQIWREE